MEHHRRGKGLTHAGWLDLTRVGDAVFSLLTPSEPSRLRSRRLVGDGVGSCPGAARFEAR
jgi:hypothetical protein